jgi:hypothetical protein
MNNENQTAQIVVVRVIDDFTLVLNIGSEHGVSKGDAFLVYYIEPDEIKDPISGESLGRLEIVRGSGSVVHVQPKMCTIKSNRSESGGRIIRRSSSGALAVLMGETIEQPVKHAVPFDSPQIGDFAKPI